MPAVSYMPPLIHRVYSSIDAGPFAMMGSVCCEGRPDVDDQPRGVTYPRGPLIQLATDGIATVLARDPAVATGLFCETVAKVLALTGNVGANVDAAALESACPMLQRQRQRHQRSGPLSEVDAASGHVRAGWVTRLNGCVEKFLDERQASALSARYKAPLSLLDCLNRVAPIVLNGSTVLDNAVSNMSQMFRHVASHVVNGTDLDLLLEASSSLESIAMLGGWEENGDHISFFSDSIAVKRMLNSRDVSAAIIGVCAPFCPPKRQTLPEENGFNGWLNGWESRGNTNDTNRPDYLGPEIGDGLGTVKGLISTFGRLKYLYSPDTAATRSIMDAALAPYNDLALMLRGISSLLSFSSLKAYSPGDQHVSLSEVWWCSEEEAEKIASAAAAGAGLLGQMPNRASDWTLAHANKPLAFKASNFRKNSLRRITADLVTATEPLTPSSSSSSSAAELELGVDSIVFKVSGACVDWSNCAAPGGLCSCNTTVRYLARKNDSDAEWMHTPRQGSTEVLCSHEHLSAPPTPHAGTAGGNAANAKPDVLLCQCASELTCMATLQFGPAADAANGVDELDTVLEWNSNTAASHEDASSSSDPHPGPEDAPVIERKSRRLPLKAGTRYRFVLTVFNGASGETFEVNANTSSSRQQQQRKDLLLSEMLQFPDLGINSSNSKETVWMLRSVSPLSAQFPNWTPTATGYETKDEMIAAVNKNWVDARGIHFEFDESASDDPTSSAPLYPNMQYTLHYSPDIDIPSTHTKGGLRPVFNLWGSLTWADYVSSGVSTLIQNVDRAIVTLRAASAAPASARPASSGSGRTADNSSNSEQLLPEPLLFQALPTPGYHSGFFLYNCRLFVPLVLVLAFIYPVSVLVKALVSEKELKLTETMKMWGVSTEMNWSSWFLVSFASAEITVTVLVILLKFGKILEHSSLGILFLFFSLVAFSTICLSFLFSVMFTKARVASSSAGLIYFLLYLPATVMSARQDTPRGAKWAACLMGPTAFGMGVNIIADWELLMVGVHSDNYSQQLSATDLSLKHICNMLFVDGIIYIVLAWYVDKVWPGDFGHGREALFFLPWCARHDAAAAASLPPTNTTPAVVVEVHQLSKVYGKPNAANRSASVLDGINLTLQQGQLTTLLGSNGAGKSTLLNIVTGLLPATSGSVLVDGYNMSTPAHVPVIRARMGVCPQSNVLFDYLTVREHITLVQALRSNPGNDAGDGSAADAAMHEMMGEVGLTEKVDSYAWQLSGGQKRKLCLLLAFVGKPSIVVLDEPTAGVDPESRRQVWGMILKHRREQTVLLCTHHMDEADVIVTMEWLVTKPKWLLCHCHKPLH